jgi:hypothetical protein
VTVGELKKMLEQYPDDMQILNGRYSDYALIKPEEWHVVEAVPQSDWVMRAHPTMSDENKRKKQKYLYLEGN